MCHARGRGLTFGTTADGGPFQEQAKEGALIDAMAFLRRFRKAEDAFVWVVLAGHALARSPATQQ